MNRLAIPRLVPFLLALILCLPTPLAAGSDSDAPDRAGENTRLPDTLATRVAPEFARYEPPASVCRMVALERVQSAPGGSGGLFRIEGEVAPYTMAGVDVWMPVVDKWVETEEEMLSVDGSVSFYVWSDLPRAIFRISSRPFPRLELLRDNEPHLHLTEAIREDHLSLYLRQRLGVTTLPPAGDGSPRFLPPTPEPIPLIDHPLVYEVDPEIFSDLFFATGSLDSLGGIRELFQRPRLQLVSGDSEPQTSASAVVGESYEVPLAWRVANPGVKRARFVVQRAPFSNLSAYTEPGPGAVVGHVENTYYPEGDKWETFWFNFNLRSLGTIEPPEAFFLRFYEEDADGNIIGWPSNTFTFVVREEPPPVPLGVLEARLKRIKCYDTSDSVEDELRWSIRRVRFLANKVTIDWLGGAEVKMHEGDKIWPGTLLLEHPGPGPYPNHEDTYFLLTLYDRDKVWDPFGLDQYGPSAEAAEIEASGMLQVGKSRGEILDNVAASVREAMGDLDDLIGQHYFQTTPYLMRKAIEDGHKRRAVALGDGDPSYSAWFDLDFYPY